ncbi:MAG TPA: AMP-binding protein [Vicinamibacterales bacterium]|nr:AMP-binding protein [Vicinamibacterales bacterium]
MARRTLLDFFEDLALIEGDFVVYDDGYRAWTFTYRQVAEASRDFAARLRRAEIAAGDKLVLWSENRAEWLAVLWGCLLEGVVLVPVDYRSPAELVLRIADIVDAKAVVVGETVVAPQTTRPVWPIRDEASSASVSAKASASAKATADKSADKSAGQPAAEPETVAEIIFTSGATAEPKGVLLTHKNILANIVPIEREVAKYRRYARPFAPIRFLNLLPLSHMFGQSMATFIPPMLAGIAVFTRSLSPADIVGQIHDRRISVLVCVPKMLEVLRDYVVPRMAAATIGGEEKSLHPLKRWWRYRDVHRMFGFKFWAFVVGAAPLDPELETFWRKLGFVVVQGYGLTETAPVVTLNHPLHSSHGAVGKPLAGVDVKIADDGEILVRGDNVTSGYYNAPDETRSAFRDGWFHTGDIGELDAGGHLRIRGRKKEMIVTPEGLNVFPDDVERVLNAIPGVRESAVVGAPIAGTPGTSERVQAVVVTDPGVDLDDVVRQANSRLLDHQKVRAAVPWTAGELPRTEGTRKLKRRELKQWLSGQKGPARPPSTAGSMASVLERFAPGQPISPDTRIDQLGLSSLERVELMMAIEETFEVTVDEARFAAAETVADLETLTRPLDAAAPADARLAETFEFPSWNRSALARAARRVSLPTWILPPTRLFMSLEVRGLEHLRDLEGPVIFAANHQSHFDAPALLLALPPRWRYRVAPAMLKEFFAAHFHPDQFSLAQRLTNSANYYLASLFFNAFPLPQRETGARQALRYIGEVVESGYSVLIFPEGRRTNAGEIVQFQRGVGMIASRLSVPVVPVRLEGLEKVLHHTWSFPARGPVRVSFGAAMSLKGNDYGALAARVEEAVRGLGAQS